jgi:NAD(P)-dependent dehydrogenase (short-subunit alcohol dehydrogenase family)
MHQMGFAGHTAYAAVKVANRSYARTWAAEFKDRGICVNTLSPGLTDTPILDSQAEWLDRQVINGYVSAIALGRAADAVEIANAAVFLGSDQSSYVTGADLMVDGGIGQV